MIELLLDSAILIDHFNGQTQATDFIRAQRARCAISVITRAEVLTGFDLASVSLTRRLLDAFEIEAIDLAIADRAAALRKQHGWKLRDALQAAIAEQRRLKLVTRDANDFPPHVHSFVLIPY